MSKSSETNFWGVHAGKTGDADELFLQKNLIALGWPKTGDLSKLSPDREAFKQRISDAYPERPGAVPVNAGQLFRYIHELKKGDFIAYPSKRDRQIHLACVEGDYQYLPNVDASYPHMRRVKWLRHLPRTIFSQGALYEIGAAITFFLIKNYTEEFRAAVENKSPPVIPVTKDESVAAVTEDIEDNARDFVLKRLSQELKGLPLEGFVAHLLECMGYHARLTRRNEPSIDVIAHKDHLGIEPPIIKVQVKSGSGVATDKDVSALYGKLSAGEYGLFVTLGTFSPSSRNFEQSKSNLRLIDGEELVQLIFQHYEQFDARHKGLLPLRRVYVPEVLSAEES